MVGQMAPVSLRYKLMCVTTFILLFRAAGFAVVEFVLELACLETNESNAKCRFSRDANWRVYATVVAVTEPIMSVVIVFMVSLFYCFAPSDSCRWSCKGLTMNLQYGWCLKRFVILLAVIAYHIFVYAQDTSYLHHRPHRYIFLPLGLSAWFVLLILANAKGPLTWIYRRNKPSCLGYLSSTIFMFASLSNVMEFMIVTVYITKTLWTVFGKDANLANVFDSIGMTATVALRIDFAMFFWDMAMLSSSKKQYGGNYKLLKDTWEDWPEYNELQPDRVISNEETEPSETASASGEVARSPSRTVDSAEKSWCFAVRNSQLPTTAERPLEAEDATVAVVGLSGSVCDQERDGSREKNVLISHDGRGRPNYGTLQIR